jgi:hypothetical protein
MLENVRSRNARDKGGGSALHSETLSVPRQCPAFPRLVLPRRVEQPFDVTVQWPHDANSRKPTHFLIWRFAAIDKVDRDKNTESSRILYLRKIVTFRNLQDRLGA